MRFTYSSGQRPLEGYTLKRGIGKGGFGEVYFALSDGGKEVALKLVRGDREIEMRGMSQCLNLKHPHLVNLYDLRPDNHGDQWVIMENVAGETLGTVLARHPNGLPRELVREWFLALTRAIGYLHDHGIVHRDLKPGNIFLENGVLKVGDYGLSKSMSQSGRVAQTESVGTVHYMAPEISTGNYNKQVDIYAAGIILYEMLTGRVPFEGESAGEILMKHLTAPPDLTRLPAEYLPIVAKALAKNPAQRYESMTEMARAIEKLGHGPAEAKAAIPVLSPAGKPTRAAMPTQPEQPPMMTALPATTLRGQLLELTGSMSATVLFAALATTLAAAVAGTRDFAALGTLFFLTVASCWAILVPGKFFTEKRGDAWMRRIVMMVLGGLIGGLSLFLHGWSLNAAMTDPTDYQLSSLSYGMSLFNTTDLNEAGYLSYFALAFFALRWWRMTDRRRSSRFSVGPILASGFWALLLLLPVGFEHWMGAVALVLSSAIVQVVSPWDPPSPPAAKKMRLRYA